MHIYICDIYQQSIYSEQSRADGDECWDGVSSATHMTDTQILYDSLL